MLLKCFYTHCCIARKRVTQATRQSGQYITSLQLRRDRPNVINGSREQYSETVVGFD